MKSLIMCSLLRWTVLALIALFAECVTSDPTALSVTPSTNWYGDDGSWSAISIRVGTPPQWVDVMVSTVSSETWVIGSGGCDNNTLCSSSRGGLFNSTKSSTWKPLGFFELGVDTQLGNTGYADYGLDDLTFGTTGVVLPSAIIGPTTTPLYLLGLFGLCVVPGNFTNVTAISAISGLVETLGAIPSHSYGYTAGAQYQQKGEPVSLTLGGYDASRFVPNNVSFELNPSKQPQVYVQAITVASSSNSNNWTVPTQLLSAVDRVSATIDSSTPYLWLPQAICDRFAASLGLAYNSSLNLYTFDENASQHDVLANSQLSFTFTLSDISSSVAVVNITVPYAAFDLQLTFPAIPTTTYGTNLSTKYYFPLRQATNVAQYTIGRAFLQEAYIITDYERNNFSVHQAIHTANPIGNTSIVSIIRPPTSSLSGPPSDKHLGLSTGAIAGVAVGSAVIVAVLAYLVFYFYSKRRQAHQQQQRDDTTEDEKFSSTPGRTLLDRLRRRPKRPPPVHEASGCTNYPTEVGADATHERFELAAPLGPAELDSESNTLDGTTEAGVSTGDSINISAYERARRKLERQRAISKVESKSETYPIEKTENDASPVAHYRPPEREEIESPLVSPLGAESGGSLTLSGNPSPISPGVVSDPTSPVSPPPRYMRIVPGNARYAGRLPDNVTLPRLVPRIIGPDGSTVTAEDSTTEPNTSTLGSEYTEHEDIVSDLCESGSPSGSGSGSVNRNRSGPGSESVSGIGSGISNDSSNGDVHYRGGGGSEGEALVHNTTAGPDLEAEESFDPWESRRGLHAEDLVHVPQPAENRYSWEEERI